MLAASCEEEFEPGSTNTVEFAGQWLYELQASDGTVIYDIYDTYPNYGGGDPFLTYNSSDNKANEVWFDDQGWNGLIRAKFSIEGTSESFKSGIVVNELILGTPEVAEEDMVDGKQVVLNSVGDYFLAEIVEAKIIPGAATVWADPQKSTTDSIYVKFAFHGADFHFTVKQNVKVSYVDRIIPTVPPSDSITYDTSYVYVRDADFFDVLAPEDTLIITGHRYTGWEVDF